MRTTNREMMRAFLQKLFGGNNWTRSSNPPPTLPAANMVEQDRQRPEKVPSTTQDIPATTLGSLFAFVDLKDPFTPSDIAGEDLPGPILSIMSARNFGSVFLFHTPHTREKALTTRNEIARRHSKCQIRLRELPVSDPKDYSSLMGGLCRQLRDLALERTSIFTAQGKRLSSVEQRRFGEIYEARRFAGVDNYVCVSSGTAEMRAAWFLVSAAGILPAKLLQVGSPSYPLFGAVNVKEVRIDTADWETVRALLVPPRAYLTYPGEMTEPMGGPAPLSRARGSGKGEQRLDEEITLFGDSAPAKTRIPDRHFVPTHVPGLDEALQELGIHVGSAVLRHSAEQAGIVAGSSLPALLLGETGTGKERFAHLIHRMSERFGNDIVAVNCAAIPKDIAESYLFGHMKGAFTGAHSDKKGVFENADRSTLFLDEIAELTLEVQAKLLRVIQDGAVQPLGGVMPRRVDVRIIAATNRELNKEVSAGRFREDLYFRLEVLQIKLPPLRDRRDEIRELALSLLNQINQRRHKPRQLSKDALLRLERYGWPGNVRQLSNVLERSVLYARSDILEADDLHLDDDRPSLDILSEVPEPSRGFSIEHYLTRLRKQLFQRALASCHGNQAEAAKLLGVSRQAVSRFVAGNADNAS
jgi:transcriptional regulator with AAA-type ATPase domain